MLKLLKFSNLLVLNIISGAVFATNPVQLAVGYYVKNDHREPFVLSRKTNMENWIFNNNIENKRSAQPHSGMLKAYCLDKTCIAEGLRWDDTYNFYTRMYMSNNYGQSWSIVNEPLFSKIRLNAFSCNGTTCIGIGYDISQKNDQKSALMISGDFGKTWTTNHHIRNLPMNIDKQYQSHAYCYNNDCFIIGTYILNQPDEPGGNAYTHHPLLLNSNDAGRSWEFKAPLQNAKYTDIACADETCLLAGSYDGHPALLRTTNHGNSWENIKAVQNLPIGMTSGFIERIQCTTNICVAVANYTRTINDEYVHALHFLGSKDKGLTWTYIPSAGENAYDVKRIACSSNTCNIIAETHIPNDSSKFISISNYNNGYRWNSINQAKLFKNFKVYDLTDVTCEGNACTVVGDYKPNQDTYAPLIFRSENNGINWTNVSAISNFPRTNSIYLTVAHN